MSNIIYKNGYPFIQMKEELIAPCMFRSFRPTPANVSLFHRAGIRLYQMLVSGEMNGMDTPYSLYGGVWIDDDEYNFSAFDHQFKMFNQFAPDSYFIIFIQVDTPEKWLERHPESASSFYGLQIEGHDDTWKIAAAKYLKTFITYCEEKYGDKICGYGITGGRSCEWFSGEDYDHPILKAAYKKFVDDPAAVPPKTLLTQNGSRILRNPSSNEVKFIRFCESNTVDTTLYFASEAQKVLKHKKFLGLFGGYYTLPNNLLLVNQFDKVWESQDVDMIWAPAKYDDFREIQNASALTVPVDSLKFKNKVHLNELDHRTELACYPMEYPVAKVKLAYRMSDGNIINDCAKSEFEALMVFRRELASTLQKGSAFWWFDFFGGYYASPKYEKMLAEHARIYERIFCSDTPREQCAEIAVITNNSAMSYVYEEEQDHFSFTHNNLLSLAKSGMPYDVYNMGDLKDIDLSQYKIFIFLNAFEVEDSIKNYILRQMNKVHKVWIYAPNVICNGNIKNNGICELTGMDIYPFDSVEKEIIDCGTYSFGFCRVVTPLFEIIDKEAIPIGRFKSNGKIGCAEKNGDYYISTGNVPNELWRKIAENCGVHIYANVNGALYVNNHFISFETIETEDITLNLKEDGVYEELFDGGIYKTVNKQLIYHTAKGTTKLFLKK